MNKQKFKFNEYFDLTHNKKYIVCYYDKSNKLVVCQYCGHFNNIIYDLGGAYGDLCEGYYFDLGIKDYIFYTTTYESIVPDCEYYKFFEVEENFDFNTIKNIYTFVIENLKSCSMNYNDVKLISSIEYIDNEDIICDIEYENIFS